MTLSNLAAATFCVVVFAFHIVSIVIVMARVRRANRSLLTDAGVSIMRPVCGVENFSEQTLRSAFHLDYRRYEILFCVAKASDPVVPIVMRPIEDYPQIPARLLVGNVRISSNPKLNNVIKGWEAASHAWIVMADSNVLMPPDYLQRLLATWRADTGVVSSPAIGCRPDGTWAELECAFMNTLSGALAMFCRRHWTRFCAGQDHALP
jgi:ceramide glucosyltransferase